MRYYVELHFEMIYGVVILRNFRKADSALLDEYELYSVCAFYKKTDGK